MNHTIKMSRVCVCVCCDIEAGRHKGLHLLYVALAAHWFIVFPNNSGEGACCDYPRGRLIWFDPTTQTGAVRLLLLAFAFAGSDK